MKTGVCQPDISKTNFVQLSRTLHSLSGYGDRAKADRHGLTLADTNRSNWQPQEGTKIALMLKKSLILKVGIHREQTEEGMSVERQYFHSFLCI